MSLLRNIIARSQLTPGLHATTTQAISNLFGVETQPQAMGRKMSIQDYKKGRCLNCARKQDGKLHQKC